MVSPEQQDPQLAIEAEGMPVAALEPRFNPDQRRAFGSVPRLLGARMDIPAFERLDQTALERVSPEGLRAGLLGHDTGTAVDSIVLNAEEYTAIVRNPKSFQGAVQSKTIAARRAANPVYAEEGELKSGYQSLRSKWSRQNRVIAGLDQELSTITTLQKWQRDPGFNRSKEVDIVMLAGQAWNGTIANMLRTYKDQHDLSAEEHHAMTNALAYRLFRGPQNERIANWGNTLAVAHTYTAAKKNLFQRRQNEVVRLGSRLAQQLSEFNEKHGILEHRSV